MSSDLAKVGDKFTVSFKGSTIELANWINIAAKAKKPTAALELMEKYAKPVIAYRSNPLAKSPLISLMGVLNAMGLPREVQSNLAGLYKANVKDGIIKFNLDREIK